MKRTAKLRQTDPRLPLQRDDAGDPKHVRARLVPHEGRRLGAEIVINGRRYVCRPLFTAEDHARLKAAQPSRRVPRFKDRPVAEEVSGRLVPWETGEIGLEVTIDGDYYACPARFSVEDHPALIQARPWGGREVH